MTRTRRAVLAASGIALTGGCTSWFESSTPERADVSVSVVGESEYIRSIDVDHRESLFFGEEVSLVLQLYSEPPATPPYFVLYEAGEQTDVESIPTGESKIRTIVGSAAFDEDTTVEVAFAKDGEYRYTTLYNATILEKVELSFAFDNGGER